jgi:HK97 family phage major capsid protein
LWGASPADGAPDTILGRSYVINQDMAAIAPSAKAVAFGDFRKYFIRRITGARVLRLVERYADYNQIGFVAFQRWDGALIDAGTHPVKYLQMHS